MRKPLPVITLETLLEETGEYNEEYLRSATIDPPGALTIVDGVGRVVRIRPAAGRRWHVDVYRDADAVRRGAPAAQDTLPARTDFLLLMNALFVVAPRVAV